MFLRAGPVVAVAARFGPFISEFLVLLVAFTTPGWWGSPRPCSHRLAVRLLRLMYQRTMTGMPRPENRPGDERRCNRPEVAAMAHAARAALG